MDFYLTENIVFSYFDLMGCACNAPCCRSLEMQVQYICACALEQSYVSDGIILIPKMQQGSYGKLTNL